MSRIALMLVVIVFALLRGGSLGNVANVQLRAVPLLFAGLGIQLVIFTPLLPAWLPALAVPILYMASMALLALGAFANRRLFGMPLVIAGLLCNFLAIAANGGYMPVSLEAGRLTGQIERYQERGSDLVANNSIATANPRLWLLNDILPVPGDNVYSIGDVLLTIGGALLCYRLLHHPVPERVAPGSGDLNHEL